MATVPSPARPFIICNYVFAAFSLLLLLTVLLAFILSLTLPDLERPMTRPLAVKFVIVIVFLAVVTAAYFFAGRGLANRSELGYTLHIIGSFLAALSCIGIIYTIVSLSMTGHPAFRRHLFGMHE